MATRKQIAANRRNALKSTGPRTDRGKSFSRLNGLTHGLRTQPGMLSAESLNELIQIRGEYLESWQPQSREQVRLVARMACAHWQQLSCQRAETRFLSDTSHTEAARLRAIEAFSQRQGRFQRAFTKAFEEYLRSA